METVSLWDSIMPAVIAGIQRKKQFISLLTIINSMLYGATWIAMWTS